MFAAVEFFNHAQGERFVGHDGRFIEHAHGGNAVATFPTRDAAKAAAERAPNRTRSAFPSAIPNPWAA